MLETKLVMIKYRIFQTTRRFIFVLNFTYRFAIFSEQISNYSGSLYAPYGFEGTTSIIQSPHSGCNYTSGRVSTSYSSVGSVDSESNERYWSDIALNSSMTSSASQVSLTYFFWSSKEYNAYSISSPQWRSEALIWRSL